MSIPSSSTPTLPPIPDSKLCYRVVRKAEWEQIQNDKYYTGSALDIKDGYLHTSYKEAVIGTIQKYYANINDVHVLVIDMNKLPPENLKIEWVPSRNNYFPHLYTTPLSIDAIQDALLIPLLEDGKFNFANTVFSQD